MNNTVVNGAAKFKKKNGLLSIYEASEPPILKWIASDQSVAVPKIEILLRSITNLQASPPTSEKLLIRVLHKDDENDLEPKMTVFSFTNRMIMDNIKDTLRLIVERQEISKQTTKQAKNVKIELNQTKDNLDELLDEKTLLNNLELQQKLLNSEEGLKQIFTETVIRNKLDAKEFWKTRLHLLGTFALKNKAKKGPYNVLSTINLVASSDNNVDLNVTREKIHAIFDQYPIVRKAYEDNVPKIPEGEFWSRFFASKLFRKLKGDKINKNEKGDVILDNYLKISDEELLWMDEQDRQRKLTEKNEDDIDLNDIEINRLFNVEANEEDNSVKLGNRPDFTMRPENDKEMVSILKGFNRLSKKLVLTVEDEENYIKLKKRKLNPELKTDNEEKLSEILIDDLKNDNDTEFVKLNFNENKKKNENFKIIITNKELNEIINEMKTYFSSEKSIDLKSVYLDKKSSIELVNKEILSNLIKNAKKSKQNWQITKSLEKNFILNNNNDFDKLSNIGTSTQTDQISSNNLKIPKESVETLRLVHITSEEFLKHFWLHFNSGDVLQINLCKKLYISIKKCIKRISTILKNIKEESPVDKKDEYSEYAKGLLGPVSKSLIKAMKSYEEAELSMD